MTFLVFVSVSVMTEARPIISNDPANDPRAGGLPQGHPALNAFVGMPFFKGKDMIARTLADRFKVIPDMRWDHKEYIYAGNRAISVWTVKGKGADGEDLNYQGCDIYTFRGGKICAKDTYWKIVEHRDRL